MPVYPESQLVGFDMCLALSQQSINSQLAAAWKSWQARRPNHSDGSLFSLQYQGARKRTGVKEQFMSEMKSGCQRVRCTVPNVQ